MKNTEKVIQIKRSWFGNWISGSYTFEDYNDAREWRVTTNGRNLINAELLDFHLLDDAQIMFKAIVIDEDLKTRIKCEVFTISDFEKVFNISISDLINT